MKKAELIKEIVKRFPRMDAESLKDLPVNYLKAILKGAKS